MTVKRGIASKILIEYAAFDNQRTYELKIKGCEDTYQLSPDEDLCGDHILFSITIPCDQPTGVYDFELLENDIKVQEGTISIHD